MAANVWIPASHEATAGGGAHRVLAKRIAEGDKVATVGMTGLVQRRSLSAGIPHVAEHVTAPLIGVEYQYVWTLLFHVNFCGRVGGS